MNNGKYLTILDICRMDLAARSGLLGEAAKRRWYPVVAAQTIRFRRSLHLFEKFQVTTEVVGWDEKYFFTRHRLTVGQQPVALAFIAARFVGPDSVRVSPEQILGTLKQALVRPETPLWLARWIEDLGIAI
jgi:acyl-CoA thioesterase FadM